ncbi:TetR/AcrR family transcriptional regulator C-terminal domain-containing protein [Streptomyces sp. NPDC054956]
MGALVPVRRPDVIDAAMTLLDEAGLDELSTRKLAERLGVKVGALYWHVKNKDELLRELADRIVGEALTGPVPEGRDEDGDEGGEGGAGGADTAERLTAAAVALRRAMLAHRDGARLVAGYAVPGRHALALADRLIGIARDAGVPLPLAAHACDALLSYTTGFVLQEQQQPAAEDGPGAAPDVSGLPHLAQLLADGVPDRETSFGSGLGLITAGLASRGGAGS